MMDDEDIDVSLEAIKDMASDIKALRENITDLEFENFKLAKENKSLYGIINKLLNECTIVERSNNDSTMEDDDELGE